MIYYSLSILMMAGVRDILVVSTPTTIGSMQSLLGTGEQWGIQLSYAIQSRPRGIADVFLVGEGFIDGSKILVVLGDNVIYGHDLPAQLQKAALFEEGAVIFAYSVGDPTRYGVVEFDCDKRVIGIEEKPTVPKSNYAIPGVYLYDNQVVDIAHNLTPSARGELEITDVNKVYLQRGMLDVMVIGRGTAWLDTGTPESLLQASNYVQTVQERQGVLVASPEEIAYSMGYISFDQLRVLSDRLKSSVYGKRLLQIKEMVST
jgi:glucose-1-phosphate thymidylyltransferase